MMIESSDYEIAGYSLGRFTPYVVGFLYVVTFGFFMYAIGPINTLVEFIIAGFISAIAAFYVHHFLWLFLRLVLTLPVLFIQWLISLPKNK